MAGFEGWISLFEDDWFEGTQLNPQPLFVDQESLSFGKNIEYRSSSVGSGRVGLPSHLVLKEQKPKGGITFQFRSSDVIKVLLCHFQNGSQDGTRFSFYPRTNTIDYNYRGTYPNQGYGEVVAQPFTVSVLKKMFHTSNNGGTNSFFFKHGICDKLGFRVRTGQDAKADANFVFRDLDYGTAVSANPNMAEVGSYATTPSFQSWSATALLNGNAFELASFDIQSDQSVQEFTRVGRRDPEHYQFSGYTCRGNFAFDLPTDALLHVGSMFAGNTFGFVATLYNSAADRVIFEMPHCARLPFDYNFPDGESPVTGKIPFQAFESNGTYPIRITVDTNYPFPGPTILDAALGARSLPSFDIYDAASVARVLANFNIYDRG